MNQVHATSRIPIALKALLSLGWWKAKFQAGTLARDVTVMTLGTALAQVITVGSYPIITRLYTPDAFGALGLFMSVVAVAGPIAALSFPIAIGIPQSDDEAKGLKHLSIATACILSALALALLIASGSMSPLSVGALAPYMLLIPPTMLFLAMQQASIQWMVRKRQFVALSIAAVAQAILVNAARILWGLEAPTATFLIASFSAGIVAQVVVIKALEKRTPTAAPDSSFRSPLLDFGRLFDLARRYRQYPIFRTPQEMQNAVSQNIPLLMLGALYGLPEAGFFALARSVLAAPIDLVGSALGNALYPRYAGMAHSQVPLTPLVKKATLALLIFGAVPFGLMFALSAPLFAQVFGSNWEQAGRYGSWISLWLLLLLANIPTVRAVPIVHAERFQLTFGIGLLALRTTAIAVAHWAGFSSTVAVALFALVGMFGNCAFIICMFLRIQRFDSTNHAEIPNGHS